MYKALGAVLSFRNTVEHNFLGAKWSTFYSTLHAEREISLRYLDNKDGVADSTEMQDKEEISYNKPRLLL